MNASVHSKQWASTLPILPKWQLEALQWKAIFIF